MKNIECKEVIISKLSRRGKGVYPSPIREITEVFEKDGTKIAEFDPAPETFTYMDLVHFAKWADKHKRSTVPGKGIEHLNDKAVHEWMASIEKNKENG